MWLFVLVLFLLMVWVVNLVDVVLVLFFKLVGLLIFVVSVLVLVVDFV